MDKASQEEKELNLGDGSDSIWDSLLSSHPLSHVCPASFSFSVHRSCLLMLSN